MESKRQLQSASLIQRQVSEVLQREGRYMYGDALVTVTRVKVTADLGLARVYLSIYNTNNKEAVLEAILHHIDRIKQALAVRIRKHVRRVPALEFFQDDTLDEMYKLNEIFNKIEADRQKLEAEKKQDEDNA
ncbi:MAG: 30S ribosome-binding factor RbfA [Bacteroidota bacterium]